MPANSIGDYDRTACPRNRTIAPCAFGEPRGLEGWIRTTHRESDELARICENDVAARDVGFSRGHPATATVSAWILVDRQELDD